MQSNIHLFTLIITALVLVLYDGVEGRGARFSGARFGGSRFSGTRSYRSGTSYRSTRSYRSTSYRSSRTRYGKYAAAFAAGYVVYGMSRYNSRYYGSRYYREDPNICTNVERYVTFDNGTISKTQKMDYFVCPYETTDADNALYCCGPNQKQHCCSYWQSGKKVGAIIGIIGGVVALAAIVACCFCKICRGNGKRHHQVPQTQPPAVKYQPNKNASVLLGQNETPDHYDSTWYNARQPGYYPNPGAAQPYPPTMPTAPPSSGYSLNPAQPAANNNNAIGFEDAPPPSYSQAAGYPSS